MKGPWALSKMGLEVSPEIEAKIWDCVPQAEILATGAVTARGMVAMMEAVKRYGPPSCQVIAADAIPRMIAAEKEYRRRAEAIRVGEENPDSPQLVLEGLEAKLAINADSLAELDLLDEEDASKGRTQ